MISLQNNFDGIKEAIVAWVQTYSGLPVKSVAWVNQQEPKLAKPFASLYYFADDQEYGLPIRNDYYNENLDQLQTQYLNLRSFKIQLEFYSIPSTGIGQLEAADYLRSTLAVLRTDDVCSAFAAAGFAFLERSNITRMDDILDVRWERRSVVDLTFLYQENLFDDGADKSYVKEVDFGAFIADIPGFSFCDVSQVDIRGNGPQNGLGYEDQNNPGGGSTFIGETGLSFTGKVTSP